MKKILYLYFGSASPVAQYEKNLISLINSKYEQYNIEYWDWTSELELNFNPSLKWAFKNQEFLKPFYKKLKSKIIDFDALFIAQTGVLTPELLSELNILKIFNTADDPESSDVCSFPFLQVVDVIVHAGVSYFNDIPLEQEFYRRGSNNCYFMPIGFYEEMFPRITNFDQYFENRQKNVVFVGRPRVQRVHLIRYLRRFNNDISVYNRRTPKYLKYFWYLTTGLRITSYNDDLCKLYWQTKVGINMHLSSGPSNVRTYQLPASGVAQLIDCPNTISKVFTPNKEILAYSNISEAIKLTEKLLMNFDFRYQIAKAGYHRTRKYYNREYLLVNMLNHCFNHNSTN